MREKDYNCRSIFVLLLFLFLPFCICVFRLYYLQVVKSTYLQDLANRQHTTYYKTTPKRGIIYDRKEKELAINFDVPSCYANPRKITDFEGTASKLAELLNMKEESILKKLHKDKAFIWIKRHISTNCAQNIEKANIEGVGLIKESRRFYPNQILASHILGFVGIDNEGLEGLELYYNDYLQGVPGLSIISKDAKGRTIKANEYQITPVLDGYNILLTIDRFIQYIAERELDKVYHKYKAKSASLIIMDPSNGEILALCNRPTFNPNDFGNYDPATRRNRAICDIFEPGSVFKIVTATCALEEKVVSLDDKIYCEEGRYKVYNHILHDYKPFKQLTFEDIIKYSSNIGVVKVAQRLDEDILYDYIKRFGFGQKTGVDLPGEEEGIVKSPSNWSRVSISAIPIGQEIAVTPLQMLVAMSAIANDGLMVKPHLVKCIINSYNECVKKFKPEPLKRVCSKETSDKLKEILAKVVESGTGKKAKIAGYSICGKTGTAQKVKPQGGYSHSKFIASFCGFMPKDNPQIAMIVVVDEPKPIYYGGSVAAPVFKNVAEEVIKYIENYGLD